MSVRNCVWTLAVLGVLGGTSAFAYNIVGLPVGGESGNQWVIYQSNRDNVAWTAAFANAGNMTESFFGTGVQGRLLTPDTADKNEIAFQLARDTGTTWIAATDQEVEGEWRWATTGVLFWLGAADGTPVDGQFNSWNPGEPNDAYSNVGEDYANVNSGGGWNDLWDDYNLLPYWAEFHTEVVGMDVASLPTPNAPWKFVFDSAGGKYMNYARTPNQYNWYLAKLIAEKAEVDGVQGRLPIIDSAAKNAEVAATGGGWLGLHCDPNLGGTPGASGVVNYPGTTGFFWSGPSGETPFDPNTYENWAKDGTTGAAIEPNNSGNVEWHGEMRSDGQWNDLGYAQSRNVIIEFPGLDLSSRQYARGFLVREVRDANSGSGGTGGTPNVEPRRLINGLRTQQGPMLTTQIAALNIIDPDVPDGGNFGGDAVFQTDQPGVDDDNFAIKAYATVVIPEAGTYTFGRVSDDSMEIIFDRGAQGVHRYVAGTGTSTTEVTYDAAGVYNIYALNGETGGAAGVELHAAKGTFASYGEYLDAAALVGDKLNGGIETRNLRFLTTAGNFEVTAGGSTTTPAKINYGAGTSGITGDYGFDQAFGDGTGEGAMTATTQIVVPENAGGWWTIGLNATKGATMTLVDSSSNPVAFGQAYGDGQLNAGAVEMTAFTAKGSAFGAVELAPGTYTLTAEYGTPATIAPLPSLSIVDGFDLQLTWVQSGTIPTLAEVNATIDAGEFALNGNAYVGPGYPDPDGRPIEDVPLINYGGGAHGHFGSDSVFPGTGAYGADNFVMKATTQVIVDANSEGYWTFCVNSDDGFQLRIADASDASIVPFEQLGGVGGTAIDANGYLQFDGGRGASDSFGTIYLEEGTYDLDLRWFEWGGGENVELSYAFGEQLGWDAARFQLLGNPQPQPENLFEVFYAAGTHDGFDGAFDLLGDNLTFEDQSAYYDGGTTAIPGDLNGDGTVNSGDLDLVRGNWGEIVAPNSNGDANGDGFVNSADLDIVRGNWGATAAAGVPEPTALVLLLGFALFACRRARRS